MSTLSTLVVKLVGDVSGFSTAMDNASDKLRAAGSSMRQTGAGLTLGVTTPIVGIGIAAVHTAAEFESSMIMMQAVSDATAEEMAAVSAAAIALGNDLELPGTSAADAGEAMVELSRAGLSVQESMDAARGVLQLSAAAQISNAEAATITANALNTFGLAGTDAARVANLLAGGANASSANITDMAAAIQMSGSVAASMGVPIEDLTTAIALMANAGMSGSDAGTSLKTMLMRLGTPTAEAAALMRSLGISIYDAQGTMLPMEQIIGQFGSALSGMTMEQRNAALATIFGADAIRAANVVLMGGTEAFNAMSTAVTAEGQAAALAAAQASGLQGGLDGLRSVVETLLLTVAGPFLEMLTGWVGWLSGVVQQLAELDPKLLNMIVVVAAVAAAIGPLLLLLGTMASGLGIVAGALGLLLSPVGLVIAAIVALGAAVVMHFGGIQETIQAASAFVRGVLAGLSGFIQGNQAETLGWVEQAWTQIRSIVTTLVNGVGAVVRAVLGVVGQFINQHGADIQAFVQRAWAQIGVIINLALTVINEVVTRVLGAVAQFINQHGAEIQMILSGAWNMIKGLIEIALGLIEGVLRVALAIIRGDWDLAWAEVRRTVDRVWEGIKGYIAGAATYVEGLVRALVNTVTQWFNTLYQRLVGGSIVPEMVTAILRWFTNLRDRAVSYVRELFQRGVELFGQLRDRVLGILGELVSGMYERGAGMVRAFAQGVTDRLHELLEAARRLAQQIRDLLPGSDAKTGPLSDLTAAGRALPTTLATAIARGAPTAVSAVETLAGGLADVLTLDTAALGAEAGTNWIEAMIKAISARLPALSTAVQGARETLGAAATSDATGGTVRGGPVAAGAPGAVTVNMQGPWYIREEADIEKLAAAVSEVLGRRAATYRRLNAGWAAE